MTTAAELEATLQDLNASTVGEVVGSEVVDDGTKPTGDDAELLEPDSPEAESAMAAGWARAKGKKDDDVTDVTPKAGKKPDEGDDTLDDGTNRPVAAEPDIDIPGLGKASEVRARMARLDALEKSVNSTAGHLGHLKQMVAAAGKGKPVTADQLTGIAEQFGPEFAEALASDLSRAGFGGASTVDPEVIERTVSEQVARATQAHEQRLEKKAVLRAHKDADDFFAQPKVENGRIVMNEDGSPVMVAGKRHSEFVQFLGSLPEDRRNTIANTWDSDVIIGALDEMKAAGKTAASNAARQRARLERAIVPTGSAGTPVAQPSVDPMQAGWDRIKGPQRRANGAR